MGGFEISKQTGDRLVPDGSSLVRSAPSAVFLRDRYPTLPNGNYWIDFDGIGPQLVYCILDSAVEGGGWVAVNSTISPQVENVSTTSSWETNSSSRLIANNTGILNVSIVEVNCGVTSYYQLQSPSVFGFQYTNTMLLMERITTIGQCSAISNGFKSAWYNGPEFSGSYTENGMCLWGDGVFANPCCGAQNMTGLKPYWVIFGSGTNPLLRYSVTCGGGTGQHYHMWFVR